MTALGAALIVLAVLVAAFTLVWVGSVRRRDASIVDICWGLGFVLPAWLYCILLGEFSHRSLLMAVCVTFWGLRLAAHIYLRHRGQPEDPRYGMMRAAYGQSFWWRSLFLVFWLQAALIWFISLPVFAAARAAGPARVTVADAAGVMLFLIGFAFEAIGDHQLRRFKAVAANHGKVLDRGLWRYSRHPNYFGDALLWWGLYLLAVSTPGGPLTVLSPALMTFLLMRVSGVTLLEKNLRTSKPGYAAYVARTPGFVPWFPRSSAAAGRHSSNVENLDAHD